MTVTAPGAPAISRRERNRMETKKALALAAFELAKARGLTHTHVPDIATTAGVSTRTFNNYFSSKEEAIAWPATTRAAQVAQLLRERPADEPLTDALIAAVTGTFRGPTGNGLPRHWFQDFRALVAREPSLQGEYLKASAFAERELESAIAERLPEAETALAAAVVAGVVIGAERAAIRYWMRSTEKKTALVESVRVALALALGGIDQL